MDHDGVISRLARTRAVRRYFGDAWVLMDRIINADDSAEHLFRYLRKHRRGVNAWFVVDAARPTIAGCGRTSTCVSYGTDRSHGSC